MKIDMPIIKETKNKPTQTKTCINSEHFISHSRVPLNSSFEAITPWLTMTQSGNTFYGPI